MKNLMQRFEAWINQPVSTPAWFGYLMMAVLASWLTAFMMTNIFKSVGIASQMIELRGMVHGVEENINPLNVRISELEKRLDKKLKTLLK